MYISRYIVIAFQLFKTHKTNGMMKNPQSLGNQENIYHKDFLLSKYYILIEITLNAINYNYHKVK